jgi:hypothetical protein
MDLFDEHVFVILLQDSKIEQRLAGAQELVLLIVR